MSRMSVTARDTLIQLLVLLMVAKMLANAEISSMFLYPAVIDTARLTASQHSRQPVASRLMISAKPKKTAWYTVFTDDATCVLSDALITSYEDQSTPRPASPCYTKHIDSEIGITCRLFYYLFI